MNAEQAQIRKRMLAEARKLKIEVSDKTSTDELITLINVAISNKSNKDLRKSLA